MIREEVAKIYECERLLEKVKQLEKDILDVRGLSLRYPEIVPYERIVTFLRGQLAIIEVKVAKIQSTIVDKPKIQSVAYNLRYMVYELMQENAISYEMLEKALDYPMCEIMQAVSPGSNNKELYVALCDYFKLSKEAYKGYL